MNSKPKNTIIQIETISEEKNLSKSQIQFNKIIKNIDAEKKSLLAWQKMLPEFYLHQSKFTILHKELNQYYISFVKTFDLAFDNPYFKKNDKKKIKQHILDLVDELMDKVDEIHKDELKDIYNKYSDEDFDEMQAELDEIEALRMKDLFENMFGFEFGDDVDTSSPSKMEEAIQSKLKERNEDQKQFRDEKLLNRKKTPKQIAKEAAKEVAKKNDEQNTSKSIKEVYRRLASALHPDREQDELERERKTKLMKEVNVAYEKKDLLRLLELQLEIEQIDQNGFNNIADDRLKYIIKILKEQLGDLKEELRELTSHFEMMIGVAYRRISPDGVLKAIKSDIKDLKVRNLQMKSDLRKIQDLRELKAFLK